MLGCPAASGSDGFVVMVMVVLVLVVVGCCE